MPLQETSGNVTTDAYGGGAAAVPNYIEDVFSTYLYTGNGTSQSIVNGVDLAGKGGLTWIKRRDGAADHYWFDTNRGVDKALQSDTTAAQLTVTGDGVNPFNTNGFTVNGSLNRINQSASTYGSWTFRKQPKFFDVVTYTGNGTAGRQIAHNLNAEVGCLLIKCTSSGGTFWIVWHRSQPTQFAALNQTDAFSTSLNGYTTANIIGNNTTAFPPTTTYFTVGDSSVNNANGATYVAYLFAHNAGGFGLTGTDNVISCGSFTQVSAGVNVNLGYEPQWILYKDIGSGGYDWQIVDNMRGFTTSTADKLLQPNTSAAEGSNNIVGPTSTGFFFDLRAGTYIYIAIRRGPMKVPTSGTSVFAPVAYTGTGANRTITSPGFPVDFVESKTRNATYNDGWFDRLRGATIKLSAVSTGAEVTQSDSLTGFDSMTGYSLGADTAGGSVNESPKNYVNWAFRRAPSFFDEVCYTGDGVAGRTITTNLNAVGAGSTMCAIVKRRNSSGGWVVTMAGYQMLLNTSDPESATTTDNGYIYNLAANSFKVGAGTTIDYVNASGGTYVAYLFATCTGVSKVGSYTGNGTTQTIDCGFTGGARFVLIKRTDSTGDWYVYDTARGMTTLTDPYLLLNSTAAESATLGSVTTVSTGFAVNASILAAINTNAASYIFFAVA